MKLALALFALAAAQDGDSQGAGTQGADTQGAGYGEQTEAYGAEESYAPTAAYASVAAPVYYKPKICVSRHMHCSIKNQLNCLHTKKQV